MMDYAKALEFIKLEQEFQRRSLEAAMNSPVPFLVDAFGPKPIEWRGRFFCRR